MPAASVRSKQPELKISALINSDAEFEHRVKNRDSLKLTPTPLNAIALQFALKRERALPFQFGFICSVKNSPVIFHAFARTNHTKKKGYKRIGFNCSRYL